jgi:enterochelin esterase-like enzyme
MKFKKIIIITFAIIVIPVLGGWGGVSSGIGSDKVKNKLVTSLLKKITIRSTILKKSMKVNVYLPKGYSTQYKYPVLYIIHGYGGNQDSWMPELKLDKKADELIKNKRIKPLIIVAPQIDNSWGINTAEVSSVMGIPPISSLNEGMYEDYLCKELVTYIDSNYSTNSSRVTRFIGGLSMGGFAALHIAFLHVDLFSKVGGHSPALILDDTLFTPNLWLYPSGSVRMERDPIYIAQHKNVNSLRVYLDCGDKDGYEFYKGCEKLYKILQAKGVKSEYHLNPGAHDGAYWEANLEKYLLFYAGS